MGSGESKQVPPPVSDPDHPQGDAGAIAVREFLALDRRNSQTPRSVVVIGATRIGKSTIVNQLFHNSVAKEKMTLGPAETKYQAASVTREPQLFWNPSRNYTILDTVGLGDPEMSDFHVVRELLSLLHTFKHGVTAILFVAKYDRWSAEEKANTELIMSLLPEKDRGEHVALVVTHFPNCAPEQQQTQLRKWAEPTEGLKELVETLPVFCVNNSVIGRQHLQDESSPNAFVQAVTRFIESRESDMRLRPTFFQRAWLAVLDVWHRTRVRLFATPLDLDLQLMIDVKKSTIVHRKDLLARASAGLCAHCLKVAAVNDAKLLPCKYVVHQKCLVDLEDAGTPSFSCTCGKNHAVGPCYNDVRLSV